MKNITSAIIGLIGAIAFTPPILADDGSNSGQLFGLVHWDGIQPTNKGVAFLPTEASEWTGQLDYLWKIKNYPYNYGGCHFEDKYFCTFLRIRDGYLLEQKAYILDDKTGEELDVIQLPVPFDLYDGAYYEPEETIYGFAKNMSTETYGWVRLNPKTARIDMVKPYSGLMLYGVVVTEDGTAYGISGDGEVYTVDRATGEATLLFRHDDLETKTVPKAHTGATWDEENGRIIFAVCNLEKDGGSRLFSVYPDKEKVELMYKLDGMGTQLAGLYFEQSIAPSAPSSPTDLAVEFEAGRLTGSLKFQIPSTTFDGSPLTGDVEYTVKVDGEKTTQGISEPGKTLEIDVNVKEAGWHSFYVVCSNDAGRGRSAKLETYAGYEAPLAPSDVSARHYGGKMHLSWKSSPSTGKDGGPVNTESIRYKIRSNSNEEFLTDPGAAEYEYSLPIPPVFTSKYYTVTAVNEDGESLPAWSNNVPLGTVEEYSQDFTQEKSKYDFTTLDANKDGKCWEWTEDGFMVMRYNERLAMDDYLTLPPMNMDYGDYYLLAFDAGVYNFDEEFEVKLAEDYNQQGMDNAEVVYGPITVTAREIRKESWEHHDVVITPPDDNKYFLSIHGISPADRNVLFIDNVSLHRLAASTVPAALTDVKAVPDAKGANKVFLTGRLPEKDVAGNPVISVEYVKVNRNGQLVATVNINGDSDFEWTDENAAVGENNYELTTGNASGDGLSARCQAYTGFVTPLTPEDCELRYIGEGYDEIEFSWTPVTRDENGLDLSDAVSYDLIQSLDGDVSYRAQGLKDTSFEDSFATLKIPIFVQYGVYAVVGELFGDMAISPQIPVGPVCALPLTEGFCNEIKMPYGLEMNLTSDESGLFTTNDTEKYQSADGDGGYGVFIGKNSGESATIYTAWLHVPKDAVEPVASLQYFGEGDAISNLIHVGVSTTLNDGFRLEKSIKTGGMGWQTEETDLSAYRGKNVRIALKFETDRNTYLRFDDFRVYDKSSLGALDTMEADGFIISTGKGLLDLRGMTEREVLVTSLDGLKIHRGVGDTTLNLEAGVYVVCVDKKVIKVIVK